MGKNNNSLLLTYTGVLIASDENKTVILDELMRKFQSAKRFSRERICEGKDRKSTVEVTKTLFLNNSRYMRDAFLEAEAQLSSQEELLPTYVEQDERKIAKLSKQIESLQQSKKRNTSFLIERKEEKVKKLQKNVTYLKHHIENGTFPKIVDGSKQLLKKLNIGKIKKREWKDARSNELFSRGEKSKGGNENTKIKHVSENIFSLTVLNPMTKQKGDRISFDLRFPDKFVPLLATYLLTGKAYTVRIKRRNGSYVLFITLEEKNGVRSDFSKGIAGMDINPDNLSVAIAYSNGNYRTSKVFWMHDINTVSADKRDWIIQNTIAEVVYYIKSFNIDSLSIEQLDFKSPTKDKSYNRMASNFAYSSITKAIVSRCFKENIALVQVPSYYSSLIGKLKYQKKFGLSVHQSAAFVLARRGLGFEEKVPKELLSVLFTKEVKKGQEVNQLFKHWKKVKEWHDKLIKELVKLNLNYKNYKLKDLIAFSHLEIPF